MADPLLIPEVQRLIDQAQQQKPALMSDTQLVALVAACLAGNGDPDERIGRACRLVAATVVALKAGQLKLAIQAAERRLAEDR